MCVCVCVYVCVCFFLQAEDGIRDLVRSRGLGDVYKRQILRNANTIYWFVHHSEFMFSFYIKKDFYRRIFYHPSICLLYTSDAADERSSVDLGGRRIIKKQTHVYYDVYSLFSITR